jgi:hypothetical protein
MLRALRLARPAALWTLPLIVIGAIYFSPRHVMSADKAVTYLLVLGTAVIATRRPDRSLIALIVLLPFQGLLLAELWKLGVPASIVRHLGAWKETLALAVIFAGARNFVASGRRADALDRLALAFVMLAALYAALQPELVPGSPSSTSVRLLGFRETAGFVLLLLGARHAPLGPQFIQRASRTVLALGAIVSAIGVFEAVFSSTWNHFVVHTIGYTRYEIAVLHGTPLNPNDIRKYAYIGGARLLQIGSVFLSPGFLAWYLILPFAIAIERIVRRQASPSMFSALLLIGAAELMTQERSAILGAVIVAALAVKPAAGRRQHWRTQVGILLAALALVAVPGAIGTGLVRKIGQIGHRTNVDTAGHITGFSRGITRIVEKPLGQGLGTGAGTGQRFHVSTDVIPENNYIEVGDELGIVGGVLFVAITLALIVWLRRLSRMRPNPMVAATWAAGIGLAVAAWFLQTWSSFEVAWTYWGLAGATLAAAYARVDARTQARSPVGYRTALADRGPF